MQRYFAIGDIHGHFDELESLLLTIDRDANFDPTTDHLIFCGDLVDVGPKSKQVVELCMELAKNFPDTFHPLMGNHDAMCVDALKYGCKDYESGVWYTQGGEATLKSYGKRNVVKVTFPEEVESPDDIQSVMEQYDVVVPKEHLNFLESLPKYWQTDKYFFVHAGIPPRKIENLDLEDPKVLEAMIWIRSEFYNSNLDFGKKVIFAHTPFEKYIAVGVSQYEPFEKDNCMGLNTMPRNDGKLTCVLLNDQNDDYEFFFQKKL